MKIKIKYKNSQSRNKNKNKSNKTVNFFHFFFRDLSDSHKLLSTDEHTDRQTSSNLYSPLPTW